MFDDFRQTSDETSFEDQPEETGDDLGFTFTETPRHFLGMTAPQRMVIAVLLLLMTCVLGSFCLLVTGRIFPPFLG